MTSRTDVNIILNQLNGPRNNQLRFKYVDIVL